MEVHASTKPEPFGRTFLEGMALGKAVIASNEGGPLDVVSHGIDGLLIQPRNADVLAEAVVAILSDRQLMTKLGDNAAVKAITYSIENHASRISGVLHQVLRMPVTPAIMQDADASDVADGSFTKPNIIQKEAA